MVNVMPPMVTHVRAHAQLDTRATLRVRRALQATTSQSTTTASRPLRCTWRLTVREYSHSYYRKSFALNVSSVLVVRTTLAQRRGTIIMAMVVGGSLAALTRTTLVIPASG